MAVCHRDVALWQPVAFARKSLGLVHSRTRHRVDSRPAAFLLFIFERSDWRRTGAFVSDAVGDGLVCGERWRSRGAHCLRDNSAGVGPDRLANSAFLISPESETDRLCVDVSEFDNAGD